jgi:hypothetical protein
MENNLYSKAQDFWPLSVKYTSTTIYCLWSIAFAKFILQQTSGFILCLQIHKSVISYFEFENLL